MVNTTNTDYGFLSAPVVEGGMINEQGVMNVALSFFDLNRNINDDAGEKEVILFNQILPGAEIFCASMSDWTFLTKFKVYDNDDVANDEPVEASSYERNNRQVTGEYFEKNGTEYVHVYTPYRGFLYSYKLPSDFLKMRSINGDGRNGYTVMGNYVFCNSLGCTLEYITTTIANIPMDFGYMIAYKCAVELAQHLDPEGTAMQRANGMLSQTFAALKQRDDLNVRMENPPQDFYIDYGTAYWGKKV